MRQLASVKRIEEIRSIDGADRICQYRVDGWWVIDQVQKYSVGDLVIYLEIDSWVPHDIAPFLSKGKEPKQYKGISGAKLKTMKMKGVLSQGLLLDIGFVQSETDVDSDLTEQLGIIKWEPEPEFLAANAKGNFPSFLQKTDQTRVQSMFRTVEKLDPDTEFLMQEKLEGSSMTVYLYNPGNDEDHVFGVCSRNLDLKKDENNTFWSVAIKNNLEGALQYVAQSAGLPSGRAIAIQGELVGPGIQGNIHGLTEHEFYAFDLYESGMGYSDPDSLVPICNALNIKTVPVLGTIKVSELLEMQVDNIVNKLAVGNTEIGTKQHLREGIIFKQRNTGCDFENPVFSFKAVSNEYLLKRGY